MNFDDLKKNLAIDKTVLDDEVIRQPVLFFEISEQVTIAIAERDAAKEELAYIDAELNAHYRTTLKGTVTRVTDNQILSHIQRDKDHIAAFDTWAAAKLKADKLLALKEAFQQRSYMLRDLVSLYSANYYETTSMKPTQAQEASHYPANRARISNARAARGS